MKKTLLLLLTTFFCFSNLKAQESKLVDSTIIFPVIDVEPIMRYDGISKLEVEKVFNFLSDPKAFIYSLEGKIFLAVMNNQGNWLVWDIFSGKRDCIFCKFDIKGQDVNGDGVMEILITWHWSYQYGKGYSFATGIQIWDYVNLKLLFDKTTSCSDDYSGYTDEDGNYLPGEKMYHYDCSMSIDISDEKLIIGEFKCEKQDYDGSKGVTLCPLEELPSGEYKYENSKWVKIK